MVSPLSMIWMILSLTSTTVLWTSLTLFKWLNLLLRIVGSGVELYKAVLSLMLPDLLHYVGRLLSPDIVTKNGRNVVTYTMLEKLFSSCMVTDPFDCGVINNGKHFVVLMQIVIEL